MYTKFVMNMLLDNKRYTGLINLAIKENSKNKEMIALLEEYKKYFKSSIIFVKGDNRDSVNHGYNHPILWTREISKSYI